VYEADKATLGAATYFVTDTNRWAVSNVGIYTGSNNPTNEIPVSSDIFQAAQSARHSPSSLRYYGLGLQNGFYNITLSFAETTILSNTRTWRSLGRRVFDIYIQVLRKRNNGATNYLDTNYSSFCERKRYGIGFIQYIATV